MPKVRIKFVDGGRVFTCDTDLELKENDRVVVESVRGMELATVCSNKNAENDGEIKTVIRVATEEDEKKAKELAEKSSSVLSLTSELVTKYNLDMKLVDVSFTLDGTKVIINYVCDDRVDFRELVKDLASQLHLRIELRQIGIRDQAKIVGGIGFCGKECCCKKYLNDFDKVSIKMAKSQGLSLNPTKISGICGRLMCCLSYENDFYSEISVKMPKLNAKVSTKDGIGTVVYNNILKQMVTVKIMNENDIKIVEYPLNEIEVLSKVPNSIDVNAKEESKEEKVEDIKPISEDAGVDTEKQHNKGNKQKHFNKNFRKNKNRK